MFDEALKDEASQRVDAEAELADRTALAMARRLAKGVV